MPPTSGSGSLDSELSDRSNALSTPVNAIADVGDVLLVVSAPSYPPNSYRVDSGILRAGSPYFAALLDPLKFAEGKRVQEQLQSLKDKFGGNLGDALATDLPIISIDDVGRIGKVKDIKGLMVDFLRILHGVEIASESLQIPLPNLANLAVVADRFGALPALKQYVQKHEIVTRIDKRSSRVSIAWNEDKTRMRILVGLFLGHNPWIRETDLLVMKGSRRWNLYPEAEQESHEALWWDLPLEAEEELEFRRAAIIRTIASLQTHFLALYTSGALQCKQGYLESPNCDIYQLGEMVKFFTKLGMMTFESTIAGTEARDPYDGDIVKALHLLRQCPSYQINTHHGHCGLRDRLLPSLDLLEKCLVEKHGASLCGECWEQRRTQSAWRGAKGPLVWNQSVFLSKAGKHARPSCLDYHADTRDIFLATERNWTSRTL